MRHRRTHFGDEGELLLYADGELGAEDLNRNCSHLAGCAECRVEVEDREAGIRTFTQVREWISPATLPPPPKHWTPIEARIDAWENRLTPGSLAARLRAAARPRYRYGLASALALLALVTISLGTWRTMTVSANELLYHAHAAQIQNLNIVPQTVAHETLQISRRSNVAGEEVTLDYQSWQDATGGLLREDSSSGAVIAELQHAYQANGFDWKQPLSATAYERWRSRLAEKYDSVARIEHGRLALTTVAGNPQSEGAIYKAQLVVRAIDWHPVVVRLWTRKHEYEIAEVTFDTPPLSKLEPALSEAPASSRAKPVVAILAGKEIGGGTSVGAKKKLPLNLPDLSPGKGDVKGGFSAMPLFTPLPGSPWHVSNAPSEHSANSTPETTNHPPSAADDLLPSAPTPHSILPSFKVRPGKVERAAHEADQTSWRSKFPVASPPKHGNRFVASTPPVRKPEQKPIAKPRKPGG